MLVRQNGRVLSKQELLDAVWPDATVDINNLNQQVATLRKVLDDSQHGWIETVPRVGFRFRGDVEQKRVPAEPRKTVRFPLAVAIVAAAVVVIPIGSVLFERTLPRKGQPVRSIAVLPLRSESSNPEDAYLGFAMADALTQRLAQSKQVTTRPTSAIRRYVDRDTEPRTAGRELQVDSVVTGTIARSRESIVITVRLVRMADGARVWSQTFKSEPARLFEFPDEIYRSLSSEIGQRPGAAVQKRQYRPPAAAYEAYLQGIYHWNRRTHPDYELAENCFQKAISIDPKYAAAWAGLSDALGFQGKPDSAIANEKALELDDSLVEAHANRALRYLLGDYNISLSRREFERALELDPTYPRTHHWYAYYYAAIGDFDHAFSEIDIARRADPSSLIIQTDIGNLLFRARRYNEAVAQLDRVIKIDPTFAQAHSDLALAFEMVGRHDDAIREIRTGAKLHQDTGHTPLIAQVYAAAGQTGEARRYLEDALQRQESADYISMAYAALGNKEAALDWLELAYQKRSAEVALLNAQPLFDPIRKEPRFDEIARRLRP